MHVVTGASQGIGRAVAAELGRRGQSVLAVARDRGSLEALRADVPAVTPVVADLATTAGRGVLYEACAGNPIESLVHGAGSRVAVEPFAAIDPDRLLEDLRIHVAAVLALTQHFATDPVARRIVVFDSYAATSARVGWAGYSIVKAAAQMVARAAAAEIDGPQVLRLYPGAVRTLLLESMLESDPSPAREVYRRMDAEGQVASPAAIGAWVADILLAEERPEPLQHYAQVRRTPPVSGGGSCLCGGIRFRITGEMGDVVACHCERCRRTSGHHVAASRVKTTDIHLDEAATLAWYSPVDDPAVSYGFCRTCGSSVFWRVENSDSWSVTAGTLDAPTQLQTAAVWFADEAADYVSLDPTVPTHRGEPGPRSEPRYSATP